MKPLLTFLKQEPVCSKIIRATSETYYRFSVVKWHLCLCPLGVCAPLPRMLVIMVPVSPHSEPSSGTLPLGSWSISVNWQYLGLLGSCEISAPQLYYIWFETVKHIVHFSMKRVLLPTVQNKCLVLNMYLPNCPSLKDLLFFLLQIRTHGSIPVVRTWPLVILTLAADPCLWKPLC